MDTNVKRRKSRAIKIVDGVIGDEISLFLKNYANPEVKVTFLRQDKNIYSNYIKLFIRKDIEDKDILEFVNYLKISMKMYGVEKVNEIYQVIENLMDNERVCKVKNFNIRHLNLNPLYQVRLPHPNYKEYK